jgi:hypothetical protein
MKKFYIFLMLMAFFAPLAMNGQTSQTVSWGSTSDNSGATTSTQNSPFGRYYGWEYKVFCYRPNTLPFSGDIMKIEFLPATTQSTAGTNTNSSITINGSADSNPMQIWMKEVAGDFELDASTAFSTYASGATKVYSGNIPATTAGTMTSFTLSTSFSHSQANSLLILVRTVSNSNTGDGSVYTYYKELTGGVNLCWYQREDNSDPGASTIADGVITNNLPVLQVTYTGGSSCSAPTITGVNNITRNSASVSWTGSNDSYILQYINLATATSTASSVTETILSQGFEGGSLPTGWTNEGAASWSVGKGDYSENTGTHNGSYNAKITHGTTDNETYLVTPAMDLTAYANAKVSCWYVNRSWAGDIDGFGVYYRIGTAGAWQELFSTSAAHSSYTQTAQLSLPSAADVQVGFKYTDNYGYGVALDDILVTGNPNEYSWTTASSNATSPYTLSGLTTETDYLVRVIGVCNGTQSDPSDVVSFTTEAACPAPTGLTVSDITPNSANVSWSGEANSYELEYAIVPNAASTEYTYDFESGNLDGWTNLIVESAGGQWLHSNNNPAGYDYTGRSHGGTGFALSFSFVDNPDAKFDPGRYNTNVYLVSPQSYQIATGASLNFWYNYANSTYPDNMEVCVATVANPTASDFTSIWNSSTVTDWTSANVSLNTYAGQTIWIAFHHEDYDMYEVWVDDITVNVGSSTNLTWMPAENPLTGLTPETTYAVRVRGNCGTDGYSQWTNAEIFTTLSACTAPAGLTSELNGNAATLGWDGYQDSYQVRYSKAFYEGFENGIPATWTTIDADGDGHNWFALSEISTAYPNGNYPELSGWAHSGSNAATSASYVNNYGSLNANDWLITPLLDLYGTLTFYVASTYTPDLDSYEVLLSTTGTSVSDFNVTLKEMTTASYYASNWDEVSIDLSSYEGQQGYIAIHHVSSNMYFLVVDDFSVSADWTTINASEATAIINGLSSQQMYEWQVQGAGCDNWSASATFTTPEFYIKHIDAYSGDGGYYLIASPIGQVNPSNVSGMLDNSYDLYYFNQAQELEWINYKPNTGNNDPGFNLEPGKGYLYANSGNNGQGIDLVFTGTAYTGSGQVTLALESGAEFEGMNLVGNPFADTAYIVEGRPFYRLDQIGAEVMTDASTGAIEPMEGVFVNAESADEPITFTTTAPSKKVSRLVLNLTSCNNVIDRAVVRFGEGNMLPKFQLNENHTKVYMTVEGKDYAVVYSDGMGEMPVNFKAEKNGNYTFNFSSEEVSFGYLHLIDNKTGNDVDLLATPSYSFDAKTTDYESRFKLVFATGNNDNDDTFAFYSNGSFVINNEGNATLQVIDINGRILKSESINGCSSLDMNAAQGIYMLRLVNGDNVKVQKVVVR